MPTITFSLKDLGNLVGKKISEKELGELIEYAKGEVEKVEGDEATVGLEDTNMPYLWSAEGIARLFKGLLGKETGFEQLKVAKSKDTVIVDKSVNGIRPYIAAFSARGQKVDEYLLKQIIQLQEKFCHSYGMRRKKVAVGIYDYKKISFPVYYKAVNPESVKFMPLEFRREMTLGEILEIHPTGKEYAWILKGFREYPLLVDSKKNVLSFPPIINSNYSGKVEPGSSELFFEATGLDLDSVRLAANVFAYALAERGFKISSADVKYGSKIETLPHTFGNKMKFDVGFANKILGLELSEKDAKTLLGKMRFGYQKGIVLVPDYRLDIMHPVDIVEEVGIAYGYNNIPDQKLKSYSVGSTLPLSQFVDKARELAVGLGYQEAFSPILSNKKLLYEMMNTIDFGTVEIDNPMTESYSAVRTWILPQMLELLSKNKKEEYPQRVFESGLVTMKKDVKDYERLAMVTTHLKASFTEMKQAIDFMFSRLGIDYSIEDTEHHAFIPGRVGRVLVKGKGVAYIGEIHPKVLENFGLTVPVAAMEINFTDLFEIMSVKKK